MITRCHENISEFVAYLLFTAFVLFVSDEDDTDKPWMPILPGPLSRPSDATPTDVSVVPGMLMVSLDVAVLNLIFDIPVPLGKSVTIMLTTCGLYF